MLATQLPFVLRDEAGKDDPVTLIFGSAGKAGAFANEHFKATSSAVAADLPGLGELAWETNPVNSTTLHDTARACL